MLYRLTVFIILFFSYFSEAQEENTMTPEEFIKMASIKFSTENQKAYTLLFNIRIQDDIYMKFILCWKAPDKIAFLLLDGRDNTPMLIQTEEKIIFYSPLEMKMIDFNKPKGLKFVFKYGYNEQTEEEQIQFEWNSVKNPYEIDFDIGSFLKMANNNSLVTSIGKETYSYFGTSDRHARCYVEMKNGFPREMKFFKDVIQIYTRMSRNPLIDKNVFVSPLKRIEITNLPIKKEIKNIKDFENTFKLVLSGIMVRACINNPTLRENNDLLPKQALDWKEIEKKDFAYSKVLRELFTKPYKDSGFLNPIKTPLMEKAVNTRNSLVQLTLKSGIKTLFSYGAFISEDGLALVAVEHLSAKELPNFVTASGKQIIMDKILGLFPENGVALIKFKHLPKDWLRIATKEVKLDDKIILVPVNSQDIIDDKFLPIAGKVTNIKSTLMLNFNKPRFSNIISLGADPEPAVLRSVVAGTFAINSDGHLAAFTNGNLKFPHQTFLYLLPVQSLKEKVDKLIENNATVPFPLHKKPNSPSASVLDSDTQLMERFAREGKIIQAEALMKKLLIRYPDSEYLKNRAAGVGGFGLSLKDFPVPDPKDSAAIKVSRHYSRYQILMHQKRKQEALRELETVAEASPASFPDAKFDLALQYAEINLPNKIEKIFREIAPYMKDDLKFLNMYRTMLVHHSQNKKDIPKTEQQISAMIELYHSRRLAKDKSRLNAIKAAKLGNSQWGLLFDKAEILGQSVNLALDTGGVKNILSRKTAARFGVKLNGTVQIHLKINGLSKVTTAEVQNLPEGLDGVFCWKGAKNAIVHINTSGKVELLEQIPNLEGWDKYLIYPGQTLTASIGKHAVHFKSASDSGIELPPNVFTKLINNKKYSFKKFLSPKGLQAACKVALSKTYKIGNLDFSNIQMSETKTKGMISSDCIMGLKAILRFESYIDDSDGYIYLKPINKISPSRYNRLGAVFIPDSTGRLIAYVAPDSPAAAGGLKNGDILLKVDGKDIESNKTKRLWNVSSYKLTLLREEKSFEITVKPNNFLE